MLLIGETFVIIIFIQNHNIIVWKSPRNKSKITAFVTKQLTRCQKDHKSSPRDNNGDTCITVVSHTSTQNSVSGGGSSSITIRNNNNKSNSTKAFHR